LDVKEKEFFKRLTEHRPKELRFLAVPGSGEVALPDYYGEKINSISDYRKWVRKQQRFIARNIKSAV
jgi:import inner membrane translocase subunit TIM23